MNMLRTLAAVLVVTLALNFVGLLIATALIAQRAHLDREKVETIRLVLFPPEAAEPEPVKPPAPAEPSPLDKLHAMLDAQTGRTAEARVYGLGRAVDARVASLLRERRELDDRRDQVARAAAAVDAQRQEHAREIEAWRARVEAAARRAGEAGFVEAVALYEALPAKQAKEMFVGLENDVTLAYLRAMDTRQASKILKEFQGPELDRARGLLELMRVGDVAAADPFTN